LFHWELVDCKLPFRGRRLRAQVCGVVNILQGLRAVALASGFKRGEFIGNTKLSPTIIRCHHHHRVAHEKIGPPHIRYPVGILNDTYMLTMTRTCLGPKSSSMRFGYSYSRDMRFSTYDLLSICLLFVLAFTLTIQDAYNGGNESSKLVSIIIFGGL
jgi:hypothetical protein